MSDSFSELITDARAFLGELADNNNREWFLEHKPRYDSHLKLPAQLLSESIAADLEKLTGQPAKPKLFRPHRDVRFSKDKPPYHLHLHMLWTSDLGGAQPVGWFFGIGLDYISVGGGLMQFDKSTMTRWREFAAGSSAEVLVTELGELASEGFRISEPELKRIPAPYDKDHPQGDLLRRKSITAWKDFDANEMKAPTTQVVDTFKRIYPFAQELSAL